MPDPVAVFRGATADHLEKSWGVPGGVYVSALQANAAQWGPVHRIHLTHPPRLVVLGNFHGIAKNWLARIEGINPAALDAPNYQEIATDAFVQMWPERVARVRRHGFDGVRLGQDLYLLGRLSDWGTPARLE